MEFIISRSDCNIVLNGQVQWTRHNLPFIILETALKESNSKKQILPISIVEIFEAWLQKCPFSKIKLLVYSHIFSLEVIWENYASDQVHICAYLAVHISLLHKHGTLYFRQGNCSSVSNVFLVPILGWGDENLTNEGDKEHRNNWNGQPLGGTSMTSLHFM